LCDTFAKAAAATAAAAAAAVTAAAAANSDTANSDTTTASAKKKKKKNESPPSWRLQNFTHGPDSYFGAGKLSLSIGNFPVGHTVRAPTICDTKPRLSLKLAFGRQDH
jgi:hypothetical protein